MKSQGSQRGKDRKELTAYDVVDRYDEQYFEDLSRRYRDRNAFARQRIRNVFSLLPDLKGKRVLDLGCGMGTFTIEFAQKGAQAVGLDLMPAALQAARRVAQEENAPAARFVLGDAVALPARTATFDIVLAADLTEHLDDETFRRMLTEVHRVLAPGGRLVIYTPEASHVFERLRDRGIMKQDPSHIGVRHRRELEQFAQRAGFSVERADWLPSHLPGLKQLETVLGRWVPLLRRRAAVVARRA